ncbi:MAG: OmpH family outer membrane protein [Planctomycetota bacterium]|nr:OmpH family outer membrane protein [Planctomycetota bacterium]
MKFPRTLLVVAVLFSAVVVFFSHSSAQDAPAAPAARATRVAVCDVASVFNNYQKAKDLNEKFAQKRKDISAEDEKRNQEIQRLEKMLEGVEPGSKIHDKTSEQLQELVIKRSVWRKLQEQAAIRWHRRLTEQMYSEILTAVETVAKRRGCDLVIYHEDVPIASETTTELLNKIAQRKCLYYNPSIDLTDAVLQFANSKYANQPK